MSEALECLEKIVDKGRINDGSCCHWRECLSKNKCILHNNDLMCDDYIRANTIKQELIKSQEQDKFISIITSKFVNNDNFYLVKLSTDYGSYKAMAYNGINNITMIFLREEHLLTEEEFTIVKERLK